MSFLHYLTQAAMTLLRDALYVLRHSLDIDTVLYVVDTVVMSILHYLMQACPAMTLLHDAWYSMFYGTRTVVFPIRRTSFAPFVSPSSFGSCTRISLFRRRKYLSHTHTLSTRLLLRCQPLVKLQKLPRKEWSRSTPRRSTRSL